MAVDLIPLRRSVRSYALPREDSVAAWRAQSLYHGYAYGYPHKTAYRALSPARALRQLFASEPKDALSLYVHVPFCEFRCGFCNLFAAHGSDDEAHDRYLSTLERQARIVASEVGRFEVGVAAIGGGTPTVLSAARLARLFELTHRLGARRVACSVETSPLTATAERIDVLRDAGVTRVSLGVQSFDPAVRRALGRPDRPDAALAAAERLLDAGFPNVNLDLIYGAREQDEASFDRDVARAIALAPSELYLYPLYVRPDTGLDRIEGDRALDLRPRMWARAAERLEAAGYEARSMRSFVRREAPVIATRYRCESDAMIGLGPGARSYTAAVHWAEPWSVEQRSVRSTIEAWGRATDEELAHARHGIELDEDDRHRRYVIQMLLEVSGVDLTDHGARFGIAPRERLPELIELEREGLVEERADRLLLTRSGLAASDLIGPYLYSARVRERMAGSISP